MAVKLSAPLVSTDWLAAHLAEQDLRVVDASWHMPNTQRDAAAEFAASHIPGAVFFDLDACCATNTALPHMLPSAEAFADTMGRLGIGNDHTVIVYDAVGLFSAARLWWMLRVFGHAHVAVLDGGLPKWQAEGRFLAHGASEPQFTHFSAAFHSQLLRHKVDVLASLANQDAVILDARGAPRFAGTAPEPRAGLRSGHIPGSYNVPFSDLLNPDGTMKSREELVEALSPARGKPVISSCGSGVTACIIDLALEIIGHTDHAVYDGSWAEWGAAPECPVELM